jgi:hypothetical protein
MEQQPSHFDLVRYALSELPEEQAQAIPAFLQQNDAARARLEELRENAAVYEANGSSHLDALMARIGAQSPAPKARPKKKARFQLWGVLVPLAVAAAIAALVFSLPQSGDRPPSGVTQPSAVPYKGVVALRIVAKRGERQFVVRDGMALQQGDALRFVISTDRLGYVTVLSFDGRGQLSAFYPEGNPADDPAPLALDSAGQHVLPGSVILDDALGEETFVVVFSETPFDRALVHRQLHARLKDGERKVQSIRLDFEPNAREATRKAKVLTISVRKVPTLVGPKAGDDVQP